MMFPFVILFVSLMVITKTIYSYFNTSTQGPFFSRIYLIYVYKVVLYVHLNYVNCCKIISQTFYIFTMVDENKEEMS